MAEVKKSKDLKSEINMVEHMIPIEELYAKLKTDPETGLDEDEVLKRLKLYGKNLLTPPKTRPLWFKFIVDLFTGFNLLLWFGAVTCLVNYIVTIVMNRPDIDNLYLSGILAGVVLLAALFTFYQEQKSVNLMEGFKKVIGDIVTLGYGDKVPADIRIIEANGLKVDNSSFTGENMAVKRTPEFTNKNPLETSNLVFFGTHIVEGNGRGVVVLTGDNTIMGGIAALTTSIERKQTPIKIELTHFTKLITIVAIVIGSIFMINSIVMKFVDGTLKEDWANSIILFIGVIIGVVPEGVLPTITVCLTLTARRMKRKNCLVKNLDAVETLGSTSTICSDKTGTLTQNRMTVAHIWINNNTFNSEDISIQQQTDTGVRLLRCMALCSRARFKDEKWDEPDLARETVGDASEVALMKFSNNQLSTNIQQYRDTYPKVAEIPFNSTEKYSLSIHKKEDGTFLLLMKGAPEKILSHCSKYSINGEELDKNGEFEDSYHKAYEHLGGEGERVLGFCELELDSVKYHSSFLFDAETSNFPLVGLTFLGLISMIDPPRVGVSLAVRRCQRAGIQVVMVTGDHPITAKAIAMQVNIIRQPKVYHLISLEKDEFPKVAVNTKAIVIHGEWLRILDEHQLDSIVENFDQIVFARTSPVQKLKIVEAYQRAGRIVAVTGDGVNDAPALRKADIGIAMGITGTEVSKQAADMLLLDDNFASIIVGVEEGRKIFDNLKKSIAYTLSIICGKLTPLVLHVSLGIPLPLSIRAIFIIDLATNLLPAISYAFEARESDIMQRPPRNPKKDRLVNRRLLFYSYAILGVMQSCAAVLSYFWIMNEHGFGPTYLIENFRHTWDNKDMFIVDQFKRYWNYKDRSMLLQTAQAGYFQSMICTQWAVLLTSRTRINSIITHGFTNNVLNVILLLTALLSTFLLYTPFVNNLIKVGPIKIHHATHSLLITWIIFAFDEIRKAIMRASPNGIVFYTTYY